MSGFFATRSARRRTTTYGALVVASIVLIAASSTPLVRDLQRGIAFAFRPILSSIDGTIREVGSIGTALTELDSLRLENDALKAENARLKLENQSAEEYRRENEILTGLLQLQNGFDFTTVAAVVIARDSSEARRVVTIDRGTNDGIEVGHVVVAAGGALVGRVVDVGPDFARVMLISDPSSTVVGLLQTSGATGRITGQLGGTLTMGDVDSAAQVALGEGVVTAGIELASGIRSPYPKGLIVGQVVDVAHDPNEVVQTVFLAPAVDLEHLEYVLVITNYLGGIGGDEPSSAPCPSTTSGTIPNSDIPCSSPGGTIAP